MAKPLDPRIAVILKKYDLDPKEALWDCKGTWVMYHRFCELIAAQSGVKFDPPQVIEANSAEKTAVLCVTGHMGDRSEWSIGEASPGNYRTTEKMQPYPYAMAEKRAKDRVILKLVGLAGFVYSEEEADDFKEAKPANDAPQKPAEAPRHALSLIYPGTGSGPVAPSMTRWLDLYEAAVAEFGHKALWDENATTLANIQARADEAGKDDIVDRIKKLYSAAHAKGKAA